MSFPWSVLSRHQFKSPGSGSYVVALGAADDSQLAASVAAAEGSLEILDLKSLKPVRSIKKPHGCEAPEDLAFMPFGTSTSSTAPPLSSVVATCGKDGSAKLWDLRAHGSDPAKTLLEPGKDAATSIAMTPDGKLCAVGVGPRIKLLDLASGKVLLTHEDAHSDNVAKLRFRSSKRNGLELVSSGDDGLLCCLDVERCLEGGRAVEDDSGLRLVINAGEAARVLTLFGEDSFAVASISTTEALQLWSLREAEDGGKAGTSCGLFEQLRSDERLAVSETDGYIVDVIYDEASERLFSLAGDIKGGLSIFHLNMEAAEYVTKIPGSGHTAVVRSMLPLASGSGSSRFVSAGEDGRVCIWATKSLESILAGEEDDVPPVQGSKWNQQRPSKKPRWKK